MDEGHAFATCRLRPRTVLSRAGRALLMHAHDRTTGQSRAGGPRGSKPGGELAMYLGGARGAVGSTMRRGGTGSSASATIPTGSARGAWSAVLCPPQCRVLQTGQRSESSSGRESGADCAALCGVVPATFGPSIPRVLATATDGMNAGTAKATSSRIGAASLSKFRRKPMLTRPPGSETRLRVRNSAGTQSRGKRCGSISRSIYVMLFH